MVLSLNVFIQFVFLLYLLEMYLFSLFSNFSYLFLFIGLDLFFFYSIHVHIKFIEGKFYFEGRACYIGKIMPTCIEQRNSFA